MLRAVLLPKTDKGNRGVPYRDRLYFLNIYANRTYWNARERGDAVPTKGVYQQ